MHSAEHQIFEASFLLTATPRLIHLDDILPGGVWVRFPR